MFKCSEFFRKMSSDFFQSTFYKNLRIIHSFIFSPSCSRVQGHRGQLEHILSGFWLGIEQRQGNAMDEMQVYCRATLGQIIFRHHVQNYRHFKASNWFYMRVLLDVGRKLKTTEAQQTNSSQNGPLACSQILFAVRPQPWPLRHSVATSISPRWHQKSCKLNYKIGMQKYAKSGLHHHLDDRAKCELLGVVA